MHRVLLALPAVLLLTTSSEAQVLKGEELKAAVVGKSGTFRTKDGKVSGTTSFSADGKAQTTGNFPGFSKDTGIWRFKGERFCVKWKRIRKGAEACFTPTRLPDGSLDFGANILKLN
jgi:hypothetical protein